MMAWRALSPRTIVAAAEAVARRRAHGRPHPASAGGPASASAGGQGGNPAAARHPGNDAAPARRPHPAD
jgi:hypothetical protein